MDHLSSDASMVDGLRRLLASTVELTQGLTSDDEIWRTPFRESEAGAEMAQENAHRESECWPWMTAFLFSRLALNAAVGQAGGLHAVLGGHGTSHATGALSRAVLESTSLAWWLLAPGIGAERRLCRTFVYRLHTAVQTQRAVSRLALAQGENPSEYGELPETVIAEIADLGLDHTCRRSARKVSCGEESWPRYTERVTDLLQYVWPEPEVPYPVLSAVGHGELLGLTRSLDTNPHTADSLRLADSESDIWLWHDAYLALGATVFGTKRAASFVGALDHVGALEELIDDLDRTLPTLRPRA
jgi:hypothetical protein